MSRKFWIRVRILGWILMFLWFLIYGIILILNTPHRLGEITNFLVGAIGTFLVLIGYYKLTRKEE